MYSNPGAFNNYYNSPVISNPPLSSGANNYPYPPYANYQPYYNYNQPNYPSYGAPCGPCNQYQYNYNYAPCGCAAYANCGQYGLSINRDRLTPNFPSKLPHSFVTSGQRVQDKLVINEPTHESAPFQSQRRKTYVPYTRKYIDYQDYIQYIPVQRAQWQYRKVAKQIDFVPQEYYESNIEYIPQQKVQHKLRYLPVEQQVIHVPQQTLYPKRQLITSAAQKKYETRTSNFAPIPNITSNIIIRNQPIGTALPSSGSLNSQQRIFINSVNPTNISSMIRPAQSTVQMVPNSRLKPVNQAFIQNTFTQHVQQNNTYTQPVQQNSYQFPSSGGVVIGSSNQQIQRTSIPNQQNIYIAQNQQSQRNRNFNEGQHVLTSVLNNLEKRPQETNQYRESLRESSSQAYNMEGRQYVKKQSIVNRFDSDEYN